MSFISTNSSGQYSPTLCIRGGVYYCQQTLIPNSGTNLSTDIYTYTQAQQYSSRINGRFDLEDNFEYGYFNFDNLGGSTYLSTDLTHSGIPYGVYPLNYWGYNSSQVGRDSVRRYGDGSRVNVCNAVVLSGSVSTGPTSVYFPSFPGASANSGVTLYGRMRMGLYDGGLASPGEPILNIGTGVSGSYTSDYMSLTTTTDNKFYWQFNYGGFGLPNVYLTKDWNSENRFYNFLVCYDISNGIMRFYEAFDDEPMTLTNASTPGSDFYTVLQNTFISDVSYLDTNKTPKIWTDLGYSNRSWTANDIHEFNQHRLNPAYFLCQNVISTPPQPSGSDVNYLNFHFPTLSGTQGIVNSGNPYYTSYYVPLTSGISEDFYEFDRSTLNNSAICMDMWVENSGTNNNGNINAYINFCDKSNIFGFLYEQPIFTWSGFPISVTNNTGPHLVRMSGLVYDENNNLSDLYNVSKSRAETSNIMFGAWYDTNNAEYSGDIKIYSARVLLDAFCTPKTGDASLTLYTSGQLKSLNSLDLYIQNSYTYNNVDLFIQGKDTTNSGCTLYIAGDFAFNSCPLYIGGLDTSNTNCTLFIEGGTERANMPLYIYSQPPSQMSGNLPLFMWATTNSGISKSLDLFIGENAPSGTVGAGMNLFVNGPQSARVTSGMNLYIKSDAPKSNGQITLYCENAYTASSGYLTLYTSTPSGTEGSVPISGNMNLFISRSSEAIAGGISLYTAGPSSITGGITAFINGGTPNFSSIPLYTDGIGIAESTGLKLYSHGY